MSNNDRVILWSEDRQDILRFLSYDPGLDRIVKMSCGETLRREFVNLREYPLTISLQVNYRVPHVEEGPNSKYTISGRQRLGECEVPFRRFDPDEDLTIEDVHEIEKELHETLMEFFNKRVTKLGFNQKVKENTQVLSRSDYHNSHRLEYLLTDGHLTRRKKEESFDVPLGDVVDGDKKSDGKVGGKRARR